MSASPVLKVEKLIEGRFIEAHRVRQAHPDTVIVSHLYYSKNFVATQPYIIIKRNHQKS
jgi:hypothetical protein